MPQAFCSRGKRRLHTVRQCPDKFRVAFDGQGHAVIRNAKAFSELAVFDVDLAKRFDVIRDERDRDDQKFFIAAPRDRLQHVFQGWFQPLQRPHGALIGNTPAIRPSQLRQYFRHSLGNLERVRIPFHQRI